MPSSQPLKTAILTSFLSPLPGPSAESADAFEEPPVPQPERVSSAAALKAVRSIRGDDFMISFRSCAGAQSGDHRRCLRRMDGISVKRVGAQRPVVSDRRPRLAVTRSRKMARMTTELNPNVTVNSLNGKCS